MRCKCTVPEQFRHTEHVELALLDAHVGHATTEQLEPRVSCFGGELFGSKAPSDGASGSTSLTRRGTYEGLQCGRLPDDFGQLLCGGCCRWRTAMVSLRRRRRTWQGSGTWWWSRWTTCGLCSPRLKSCGSTTGKNRRHCHHRSARSSLEHTVVRGWRRWALQPHVYCCLEMEKGKGRPYSITEHRVPELIPVLGSQPAGDVSP